MWNEFSSDESVYDIDTQFMLGSALLIAPKIKWPSLVLDQFGLTEVDYFLPAGHRWYEWHSGE